MYKKTVLDNGVRIITESMQGVKSVSLGISFLTGSIDEEKRGISHLCEHMLFKGTKTRTARDIAVTMDSIGGELNGFTAKEFTYYYARFLDEHLNRVWDLLSDILTSSIFDGGDLKKEKQVIGQEIKSFEDSPEQQSFQKLSEALFKPHPIAFPIMGSRESLDSISRKDIVKFVRERYTGENTIIAASGNLDHDNLVSLISSSFKISSNHRKSGFHPYPKFSKKIEILEKRDISQVHLVVGRRTVPYDSKERYPLLVLNTLLGGSISSRLFQRLREKEGLVYNIFSFIEFYSDMGTLGVYLATDPKNMRRAIEAIFDEFEHLKRNNPKEEELSNTKEHLKGGLMLGLESTLNRMIRILKEEMWLKRYVSLDETLECINRVRGDDISALIDRFLIRDQFCMSIVGPPGIKSQLSKVI
jgi:predicted Zn-dependent peptidase